MKIAITGGTGFVGRNIAARFPDDDVVIISRRTGIAVDDATALAVAFAGCEVVVHCAGINREIGEQTYQRVHIEGTESVLAAARAAGGRKIVMLSFLRARPNCGSPYHESKWRAEELVRGSGLDYTILKAGMIYGRGDHLIDHLSHTVQTVPLFASVGFREKPIAPIPVADLVDIVVGAINGRMAHETVTAVGAEQLLLTEALHRVARIVGRRVWVVPAPVWALYIVGQLSEWAMTVPLVAKAQVRMLAEGVVESAPSALAVPPDLAPRTMFTDDEIRRALPEPGGFGLHDLRLSRRRQPSSRS